MSFRQIIIGIAISVTFIAVGCEDPDMIDSNSIDGKGKEKYFNLFDIADSVYAVCKLYESKISIYGNTFSTTMCEASAWNDADTMLAMGDFEVNGVALNRSTVGSGGIYYSNYYIDSGSSVSVPIYFNTYQTFTSSGSSSFPTWGDSLLAPSASLTVSAPTQSDTVSKSSGFTIYWNSTGSDVAKIWITDTVSTPGHVFFGEEVSDNGSYFVNSSQLSNLSTGPITITVGRGNYTFSKFSGHKYFLLATYSLHEVHLNMN